MQTLIFKTKTYIAGEHIEDAEIMVEYKGSQSLSWDQLADIYQDYAQDACSDAKEYVTDMRSINASDSKFDYPHVDLTMHIDRNPQQELEL